VRDGRVVRFVGASAFFLQEQASRELLGDASASGHVARAFDAAQRAGVTVLRVAAFHESESNPAAILRGVGVYVPAGLAGLDRVVSEAGSRRIGLVLVLSNYWDDYGGVAQWLRWHAQPADDRSPFFTTPALAQAFEAYAVAIVSRRNALTGVRYADDPTIVGWEVMNEPRAEGAGGRGEDVVRFVGHAARAIHAVAPRQLVFAGDEGFDADVAPYDRAYWERVAPGRVIGPPRLELFGQLVREPGIDVATIHWYPRAWGIARDEEIPAGVRWIEEHARIAAAAGRPLVVEEFGLPNDGSRAAAYESWFARADAEPAIAGVMPWGFTYVGRPGSADGFEWSDPDDPARFAAWSRTWSGAPRSIERCGR